MKFTLITLVLCMFLVAALTEAGKAGKSKKKGQNNKGGKRLPGVACGLKCKDECNVNKSCKKKCMKYVKMSAMWTNLARKNVLNLLKERKEKNVWKSATEVNQLALLASASVSKKPVTAWVPIVLTTALQGRRIWAPESTR